MSINVSTMQNPAQIMPLDSGIRIYEICDSSETNPKPENEFEVTHGEFISHQKLVGLYFFSISHFAHDLC